MVTSAKSAKDSSQSSVTKKGIADKQTLPKKIQETSQKVTKKISTETPKNSKKIISSTTLAAVEVPKKTTKTSKKTTTTPVKVVSTKKIVAPVVSHVVTESVHPERLHNIHTVETCTSHMNCPKNGHRAGLGFFLIFLIFVSAGLYMYTDYRAKHQSPSGISADIATNIATLDKSPLFSSKPEEVQVYVNGILERLGQIFVIDAGDFLRDIKVITDLALIQKDSPENFRHAQNGDYILYFQKRAVVFRDQNIDNRISAKIIEVIPYAPQSSTPSVPSPAVPVVTSAPSTQNTLQPAPPTPIQQ